MGLKRADKFKQASNRSWTQSKIFFRHDLNEDSNICLNDDVRRPCEDHVLTIHLPSANQCLCLKNRDQKLRLKPRRIHCAC